MIMARIPEEEIPRLKKSVSLTHLCAKYGIGLKTQGKNLVGTCPFHDDKTPSFVITPTRNLWHCFGACNRGGSNIDLVMQKENVDFRRAVEILRGEGSSAPPTAKMVTRLGTERAILVDPHQEIADDDLMHRVVEFYHETFMNRPQAMQYLQGRGCFHPEAVKHFKLGYSNRLLGYHVPDTMQAGKKLKARLQKLGLIRESGHEHFNGCLTFPIFHEGRVTEMYGRKLIRAVHNAPDHLYLGGPHAGVWNADGVRGARQWLLCEALIDALSLWSHGFHGVTASYGVNGFTPDHWSLLKHSQPDRVLICYDNDTAGNKAANELAQQLEPLGIEAWRVELRPNSDINDLVRKHKTARAALESLFAAARRMLIPSKPRPATAPEPLPLLAAPVEEAPAPLPQDPTAEIPPTETPSAMLPSAELGSLAPTSEEGAFTVNQDGSQAELTCGMGPMARQWRVRGLETNRTFDHLKINLRLSYRKKFHLDSFDLFNARARTAFLAAALQVTGADKTLLESDLSQLLAHLEDYQDKKILGVMQPAPEPHAMLPEDEAQALALLREPRLFERILADFAVAGTVGEDTNKLAGYLVTVSRKLDKPLSAMVVARSAAGKSSLLNAVLDFVPDEDKQVVTSMTGQALYYMAEDALKHKVLAVMEDEGSQQATYPLKVLQSEKKLVLAVTVRDPEGGMPETKLKTVEGPVAELMTSTRPELDYELENRHIILTVDEDREQTRRIHAAQREAETLRGLFRKLDREQVLKTHHNAQRLLRPLRIINPYADKLTFADDRLRLRRDHEKYLGLIRTIAFLRQYQKPIRSCDYRGQIVQYIEVDAEDLRLAHDLAARILGRSLDELSPPTRSFLTELHKMVKALCKRRGVTEERVRFTRREVRDHLKWSVTQVREHLSKLLDLEYVIIHRVPGLAARSEYELLYDGEGQDGAPFVMGLTDLNQIDVGQNGADVGRNGTHDG